jgi:hypothetical protein
VSDTDPRLRTAPRQRRVAWLLVVLAALGATAFGGAQDVVVATDSCEPSVVGSWDWHGTVTNTSDTRHRYVIRVRYTRGDRRDGKTGTTKRAIPPGRTWNFELLGELSFEPGHGEPRCKVTATVLPQ